MKSKKGLSLLVLTITIMVMILLASIVVFTAANTTNNSKKAAFASDLEQIEELVKEYYLANGTLPVVTGGTEYTKTTFTNLITDGKSSLESEISENGDDSAVFYKIDLSKLDIESTKRGLEEDGDTTDAYFLASGTFNVYYLKGEEIADEYYFSLSERLTGKLKVANSQTLDTSSITVSSVTGAIKLTKSTAEYTNALTVDVKVNLEAGETMKYTIAGQEITVATGATTIDVANIVSNNSDLKTLFYQNEGNKYLTAQKYSSGNVIAEVKLNIANLDILSGNVSSISIEYNKYSSFILAKISGYADLGGSGVKEARVLYTTKKESNGTLSSYYANLPTTITKQYVKQAGKAFSATTLKLPQNVKSFKLVFIDNAGNVSEIASCTENSLFQNAKEAIEAGIEIGDTVTGYTLDSSKTSYTTSGKENTVANAGNSGSAAVTQVDTPQTVKQTAYSTWKYVGISQNGEILIAPDIPATGTVNTMNLSGKGGYLNGPAELDKVCNALYSTDKGISRSMNIEDINRMLNYTGTKGTYWDESGNAVRTAEAKKISEIGTLTNTATPDGRPIGDYYSNYYSISKTSDKITATDEVKNFVYSSKIYWLASSSVDVVLRDGVANFDIRCVSSDATGGYGLFRSSDISNCIGAVVRPIVSLKSNVHLIEQSNGTWKIT